MVVKTKQEKIKREVRETALGRVSASHPALGDNDNLRAGAYRLSRFKSFSDTRNARFAHLEIAFQELEV
jgi:hypothetical protein